MATVNLYLDTRRCKIDGTSQVKLSVNLADGNRLIPLGIYLNASQWDAVRREVNRSHPRYKRLNVILGQMKLAAEDMLLTMRRARLPVVVKAITEELFPEKAVSKKTVPTLVEVAKHFAAMKSERSTRLTYERTITQIERFRPLTKLSEVSKGWLMEFDAYMAVSMPSPNSRAMMMRNLRAVFNYAIDEGLTDNYPFRRFKIKTVATAKRNLNVEQLRRLFTMETEEWQRPYLDFFILSFMLIGINAKDLLHLPAGADSGGRVVFNRAKTKRLYSIKVEPEARVIIDRYRGVGHMLNMLDTRTDYMQYIRQCNHALQLLGTQSRKGCKPTGEPLHPELTTYWARHSWATIAASLDIPKETIAAGLGHGGNTVTDIYIDYDMRKVDDANRKVLDYVLYGRRPSPFTP